MRFHVLGIPHTVSVPEYSSCAFTQKVVKLCTMLTSLGHHVIHYGHEDSKVDCTEHVTVTTQADLDISFPGHDWKTQGWPNYDNGSHVYKVWNQNTHREILKRLEKHDFLMITFGGNHKALADAMPEHVIKVESGIGYPGGGFAPFRVFESYAIMHVYQGMPKVAMMATDFWYDVVIPNAFDLKQFEYKEKKEDYFLYLGRVTQSKGVHIAMQLAERTKTKLIVAGAGSEFAMENNPYVEFAGVVGPEERSRLMSNAKATLCPSMFLEPFCGVQVESMLCGTPVISSNWGAFAEINKTGLTGFRCNTFGQFIYAAENIHKISPSDCRQWAERYSLERVAKTYDAYFKTLTPIFTGDGWYQE